MSLCLHACRQNDSDWMRIWFYMRVCLPANVSVYSSGIEAGY